MTLPDFVVIGAARAGTTWLDAMLRTHPGVYLPTRRKEVHFFDQSFDRGVQWYEQFFPDGRDAARYSAIGETTPRYLYEPEVPARIGSLLPDARLVAILRHPTDRAHSQHGLGVRDRAVATSFEQAAEDNPHLLAMSRYGEQLQRYVEILGADRLHVMILEEASSDPAAAIGPLAEHLGVDPAGFDVQVRGVNESFAPRRPRTRAAMKRIARTLRRRGLDGVAEWGKRTAGRTTAAGGRLPDLDPATRQRLDTLFAPEIAAVEDLLGREIPAWHRSTP